MSEMEPLGQENTWLAGPDEEELRRQTLLEEVLLQVLPQNRAREAMQRLLEHFGCFRAILSAPEGELTRLGLPEEAVQMLLLSIRLARACLEDDGRFLKRIYDTQSACEVMRPKFLGLETEIVTVLLINGRGQAMYHGVLAEGSVSGVPIYLRRLLELCIHYDCQSVFIAHNHPSGAAVPSRNDLVVTQQLEMALKVIDVHLEDHIIFAGEDFYSFQTSGMLEVERTMNRRHWQDAVEDARQRERKLLGLE